MIANTPTPPYYAVIFTNTLSDDTTGYEEVANRMVELAEQQPGYLGMESVRDGLGITVSYWQSLDAIKEHIILCWALFISQHSFEFKIFYKQGKCVGSNKELMK